MTLPCPECGDLMIPKITKAGTDGLPGLHFYCARSTPVQHRVTIFWKRPQDASRVEAGGESSHAESDREKTPPEKSQVSLRVSSLLARADKLRKKVGA